MTHPPTCRTISANVGEAFVVVSIRRAERDFLDGLIDDQAAVVLLVDNAKAVSRYVKDDFGDPFFGLNKV